MARGNAVWGIDVGNCSLKAMRCYVDDQDPTKIVADACDYIEYPMILTQTGADADQLINDALKEFMSRNNIRGDKVIVSVAGQNGLVRFIKLPPIEAKKIPDIVRYEAKQQIPFDLNDVIWDYQRMGKEAEEGGLPLEVEIGLFAMKREQAFHMLDPYEEIGIPVDCLQLAPLAVYNYMMADELKDLPSTDDYDPENPPPYVVVLSMGTDATDLILTNGFRVWQRNLPIGGSYFTKALTKELKLTFAKADHLKRNLATSQDKVAVLKAMQPAFNSFQNEIQRSLGFFSNMDRNAQYERVIALGGPMKLTGLTKYLSQNLGVQVTLANSFPGLDTSHIHEPVILENMPSFGVCYGLCLQGLKRSAVRTNLLPPEITRARIINSKKPWAVAALALLSLGATISFGAHVSQENTVAPEKWQKQERAAETVAKKASEDKSNLEKVNTELKGVGEVGQNLVDNSQRRLLVLELLRGINACLPTDGQQVAEDLPTEASIRNRPDLHVQNIELQKLTPELREAWMTKTNKWRPKSQGGTADESGEENPEEEAKAMAAMTGGGGGGGAAKAGAEAEEPGGGASEGQGDVWLVAITGVHYHNGGNLKRQGAVYVRETLIKNILEKEFKLPRPMVLQSLATEEAEGESTGPSARESAASTATPAADTADKLAVVPVGDETVTMANLGVLYPVLVNPGTIQRNIYISNPYSKKEGASVTPMFGSGFTPTMGETEEVETEATGSAKVADTDRIRVEQFSFTVHFLWEPKTPDQREAIRLAKEAAAKKAAEEASGEPGPEE